MNSDPWLARLVIISVSLIAVIALAGYIYLPTQPPSLLTIATGALGGLLGYMAPSPMQRTVQIQTPKP